MCAMQLDFFLGAWSSCGFCGHFSHTTQQANNTIVLLKGSPGCGKSTLLKAVGAQLLNTFTVEMIHCAADPSSLDGIICTEKQLMVLDATAPHAIEPNAPVAIEDVISLYRTIDRRALRAKREDICALNEECQRNYARAVRYITAAASLLQDSRRVEQCCMDKGKIEAMANALSRRYLPCGNHASFMESRRLLSAVTPDGLSFFENTLHTAAQTIIAVDDPYGSASAALLRLLKEEATQKGIPVYVCYCSMFAYEKIDHLIFPTLQLAFTTQNAWHCCRNITRTVHYTRFCKKEALRLRRNRLHFNQKAVNTLLTQAQSALQDAKNAHDNLENIYKQHVDFSYMQPIVRDILAYSDQ